MDDLTDLMVTEQRVTCDAAPVEIQGILSDGREFYFRARHRSVYLSVGDEHIGLELRGFYEDANPMSYLSEAEAQAMLAYLVRLLGSCEHYRARWEQ